MYIRAKQTCSAIKEAFFVCLKDKRVNDISISEICRQAGLNRTTFYKHYKSTDDIIRELETEQLDKFRTLFETRDKFGEELIEDILDLIEENKQINKIARERILSDRFLSEMAAIAKNYAYADWKKKMTKATEQEVELALTIMISAALQVVVNEADKYDRETVVRYIKNMINGCVLLYT